MLCSSDFVKKVHGLPSTTGAKAGKPGNSPSAKIRVLNEAILLFSVVPAEYRKLLVMLRHLRRDESLATNWLRNHGHQVPPGVEI